MVSTVNADFDILEGVVQRLIRRVGQADRAFRPGDDPAVQNVPELLRTVPAAE